MAEQNPYHDIQIAMLAAALPEASFSGWTPALMRMAAEAANIDENSLVLAFPNGVRDLIAFYSADGDKKMLQTLLENGPEDGNKMKIRARIREAVAQRLHVDAQHRAAARRAATWLSVPGRQSLAARLLFNSAHVMWRWAGDTSSDYNYYTKRIILGAVLASTRLVWFDDESDGFACTLAFLDRRINNVMQFEKLKATLGEKFEDVIPISGPIANALSYLARWRFSSRAG